MWAPAPVKVVSTIASLMEDVEVTDTAGVPVVIVVNSTDGLSVDESKSVVISDDSVVIIAGATIGWSIDETITDVALEFLGVTG